MVSTLKFLKRYAQEGDEWLEMKHGIFTTLLNPSNSHRNGAIRIQKAGGRLL
jgi:hypothetical protein